MTLKELKAGESARILSVGGEGALRSWKGRPNLQNILLRAGLGCAALLPAGINAAVYQVRLALF